MKENVVQDPEFNKLFKLFDYFLEAFCTLRGELSAFWMSYVDMVALLVEVLKGL